jgi:cysteine synthase B
MAAHPAQACSSAGPTAPGEGPVVLPTVLQLIGNTPLVEIRRVRDGVPDGVRLFGKIEGFNPGGSVKDRPALRMVQEGIAAAGG